MVFINISHLPFTITMTRWYSVIIPVSFMRKAKFCNSTNFSKKCY